MPSKKNVKKSAKPRVRQGKTPKGADKVFKSVNAYGVNPEPFPRVLFTRVKYSDAQKMTMVNLDQAKAITYRMTSIWDPEYAAGGSTVSAHSVLKLMYDRYQVQACKITISFNDPNSNSCRVGYRIRIGGRLPTASLALETISSQPLTYIAGLNTGGPGTKTFNAYIYPWTLHGISKLEYMANSSVYTSGMSASPANADLALLDVFISDRNSAVASIEVLTKIVYYVKFYDRLELQMSY